MGAAIAVLFGSEGAQVVIADLPRTADAATSVVTAIRQAGGIAHFVEIDVRDATTARAAVDQAAGLMSGIDTVVASAGSARRRNRTARFGNCSMSTSTASTW